MMAGQPTPLTPPRNKAFLRAYYITMVFPLIKPYPTLTSRQGPGGKMFIPTSASVKSLEGTASSSMTSISLAG